MSKVLQVNRSAPPLDVARSGGIADPGGKVVAIGLLVFAVVWLTHLATASLSAPTDNIEQLTWVRSMEWGYYKHPPLPTWLIWLPVQLFGVRPWVSYVLGATFTLGSIGLLWHLLARLRGRRYAAVALLAVLCITFYNGRLNYYNHNVVLMFFNTVSAVCCWQAMTTSRRRWWVALGVALGLGALSKYQIAVTMLSVVAFWLHQRGWRHAAQRQGLALAAGVSGLLFAPHVVWLVTHDFPPVQYAMTVSLGRNLNHVLRWTASMHWLADQLFNRAMPAWLLLAAAAWPWRGRGRPVASTLVTPTTSAPAASASATSALPTSAPAASSLPMPATDALSSSQALHDDRRIRALMLSWGVLPLAFMVLLGVTTGAKMQLHWGTPFLLFTVPAVMDWTASPSRWSAASMGRVLTVFALLQGLLMALSYLTSPLGPAAWNDGHWRTFDSHALAAEVAAPARRALGGGPICVVIGPAAKAGALALALPGPPKVLIDGRLDRSPWIDPGLLTRCGALVLEESAPSADSHRLGPAFPNLTWRVVVPGSPLAAFLLPPR